MTQFGMLGYNELTSASSCSTCFHVETQLGAIVGIKTQSCALGRRALLPGGLLGGRGKEGAVKRRVAGKVVDGPG